MSNKSSSISKTIILLVMTFIIAVSGDVCSYNKEFEYGRHIRPFAVQPRTNLCYWAFDQGPCQPGEWFRFGGDVEAAESTRPGYCEKRVCPQNSEEDSTAPYPRFWFEHKGLCLKTDVVNPTFCGNTTTKVYFTEDDEVPACRKDQPDEIGGRGLYKSWFKRMRGF